MLPNNFAYITILTSLIGGFVYIKSTFEGKTKPNRMSWLIWVLAACTASFVQFANGAQSSAIPIFMAGFIPLLVLIASFRNKNAYWEAGALEYICLVLAILSLIMFVFFKTGVLATIFAILADGLGFIPTYVKSWKAPKTENLGPYVSGIFNPIMTLLTLPLFTFNTAGFAAYLFLGNLIEILIVFFRKNKNIENLN
jgi:hypothetical protein